MSNSLQKAQIEVTRIEPPYIYSDVCGLSIAKKLQPRWELNLGLVIQLASLLFDGVVWMWY